MIRIVTLVNVFANLFQNDLFSSIGCQGWLYFEFITAYLAMLSASFLLILNIAAIWDKNRRILGTCITAWLINLAFVIRCIASTKARHSRVLKSCVLRDGTPNRDATLAALCSEMILLTFMLTGLVRQRDHYLGRLLFHHGLVWLLVAIFGQVPLLVLLSLNPLVQDLGNLVFHSSALLSIAMCVTRLFRSLSMIKEYQRRPKSLNLSISAPNPIVYTSFNPNNQTEPLTRRPVGELPRLTLSFTPEASDEMGDGPPEKRKHTDMDTFENHHVV
ncbi:hypothetical protein BGY98DRAFT_975877 [Russula aff. rugulosa BPL654]|nr:hypothetical protein BGY98DRAFT_975877 [Russula aff. rugulosa BPL654]